MAATVTYGEQERIQGLGGLTIQHGNIVMDSSYPTGGETVAAENWSSATVLNVFIDPLASNATYYLWYDDATDVVYAATRADGAEVANTTDLSAVTVPFWIIKKK